MVMKDFLRKVEKDGRIEFEEIPNIPQFDKGLKILVNSEEKTLSQHTI